jgi:hypothetical protein
MRIAKLILLIYLTTNLLFNSIGQESFFNKIELRTDTSSFSSLNSTVEINGEERIYFYYSSDKQVVEVRLYPKSNEYNYTLNSSRDFELVDSILHTGKYYRFKIRFLNLNRSELLRLTLSAAKDTITLIEEVLLQPLTYTTANIGKPDIELFIGEEKTLEVYSNNIDNLTASSEWMGSENYDYRFSKDNSRVFLHLVPKKLGEQKISFTLRTNKPFLMVKIDLFMK